jgi:N-acetylmuramoyl-L-alanine amidase
MNIMGTAAHQAQWFANRVTGIKHLILAAALIPSISWAGGVCSKSDFIVAIDTGHSLVRGGAFSARGVPEYSYNRKIAELLLSGLVREGFNKAVLINPDGSDMGFEKRIKAARHNRADLIISIHHDSVQPHYLSTWQYDGRNLSYCDRYKGFSIFYSGLNTRSKESLYFAELLGDQLLDRGFSPSLHHAEKIEGENRPLIDEGRGIYRFDQLAILKGTLPAILLECGIIVNRDEEVALSDNENKREMVSSIVRAIEKYCSEIDDIRLSDKKERLN